MAEIKRTPKPTIMFEENAPKYNQLVLEGKAPNLACQNLSDLDLRAFNLTTADLRGCYLRGANLSGLDLSGANLDGASIKNAQISGCLFPHNLSACEIQLSLHHGTRLRQSGRCDSTPNKG
ncbi:MAG: pentapeptide repeat-containing protein [Deltaproteobacteria bacterium]|jgi:uncharacterized protein YjbI with pentapeptide repeats|nr:pentapeptide repeat-containing protein [Deltaproteobacteria bacterium]